MVRVGVVGMGIRGQLFARALIQNRDAELAAMCEPDTERAHQAEELFGLGVHTDLEHFFDTKDLEAIIIATPDHMHYRPFVEAAGRDLHIMVEKPLSVDVKEAVMMNELAERSKRVHMVAFENRWNPPFRAAKMAIEGGDIGEVRLQTIQLNDTIYVPTRMLSWASHSSPAWFLMPHCVDLARWLSEDEVTSVYAVGSRGVLDSMGIHTYDSIQSILTFAHGGTASLSSSWILPESMPMVYDFKYEIVGSKASLLLNFQDQVLKAAQNKWMTRSILDFTSNDRLFAPPVYMVDAFIDSILMGKPSPCPMKDGLVATQIISAICQSVSTGQRICMTRG